MKSKNFQEQTEIARQLGVSNNAFKRIVYYGKLEYRLINNKRHYDMDEVLRIIRAGKSGEKIG